MNDPRRYQLYKGLQKPLSYKGLKGKFIGWGASALVGGLISGGLIGAMLNMYFGALFSLVVISSMFMLILSRQRKGLHTKTRHRGIFIQPSRLKISYGNKKQNF
ncbi:DUF4133 domain-containing protein [Pedobacter miscanthi]|jgi:predicted lipid-binding transport protein (Tim44 family)|uniref:DUF4133 domain-containing protein n=1 Tax=Pedobacter miscanthi TaxID=2259170 RepID=UPI0029305523|nr:DUF4133 domain-containing protein [Pedobacter miscanthi]